MKSLQYILVSVITLMAVGCERVSTPEPNNLEIRLTTSVNNYTRAKGLDFETGDHFGLFMIAYEGESSPDFGTQRFKDNLMCTKTETGIEHSRVYYPESGKLDFYAYYPYSVAGVSPTDPQWFPHTLKADQSDLLNYNNNDFLTAKTSGITPSQDAVPLLFSHRMSLVNVQLLPGGELTVDNLKNARMTTGALASDCRINIVTGEVSDLSGSIAITPNGNQVSVSGGKVTLMSFIAIPQTIPAGMELFDITIGTKHYKYVTDKAITLESEYKYMMEITLQPAEAQVKAQITASHR